MRQKLISDFNSRLKTTQAKLEALKDGFERIDRHSLLDMVAAAPDIHVKNVLSRRLRLTNEAVSLELSIARLVYLDKKSEIRLQSGVLEAKADDGKISVSDETATLVESMGGDLVHASAGRSLNSEQGQKNILSLKDYLSRPALIDSRTLAVGAAANYHLAVWDLFTLLPSIRAKLRNYAFIRANLHVRIVMSGTPFHFGRMLISPQPLAFVNQNLINITNAVATSSAFTPCLLNYLSQARGSIVLNVNENVPIEIVMPYISTKPMHRLFNKSASPPILDTASFDDLAHAGDIFFITTANIQAVGVSDTALYIQTYAWMEDVELGTNTGTNIVITTESGKVGGELKTGPVQQISSKLMRVSKALESVAFISPYATASTMFLTGVNKIATILGWSKPVKVTDVERRKPECYSNIAQTIGNDCTQRLVLDPLQELNVDGLAVGVDIDEMSIASIAARRTFLTNFTWAPTDAPLSNINFSAGVTPNLVTQATATTVINQPTAMAFAVLPFEYWRGDIVFRFEVVCSVFHRGKIAVLYEPNLSQVPTIGSEIKINKQFIRVVDLQDTHTFEVRVNWASYRAWLKVGTAANAYLNTSIMLSSQGNAFLNGAIMVTPFTQLQSNDGSSVTVNVYAYCENLQVNGLTGKNMYSKRAQVTPPGGINVVLESGNLTSNSTIEVSTIDLNPSTASTQHICQEHFGEQPLSFRSLLKRYVTTRAVSITDAATTNRLYQYKFNIFPPSALPYGAGVQVVTELFTYLRYAYLGYKGGIRTMVDTNAIPFGLTVGVGRLSLMPPSTSVTDAVTIDITTYNVNLLEGTMATNMNTNTSLMCETPFYSNNLFVYACSDTLDDGLSTLDMMEYEWFRGMYFSAYANGTTPAAAKLTITQAAAEDFSFLRFLGAPYYTT